jgi:hypothetical protein
VGLIAPGVQWDLGWENHSWFGSCNLAKAGGFSVISPPRSRRGSSPR